MIRAICIFIVLANSVSAQDLTTDAFGILPSSDMGDRENWAGLRVTSGGVAHVQDAGAASAALLFVGPKSIVAGVEPGHAAVLALDVFGNTLNGAPARFALGYGDDIEVQTRFGIGDTLFTPPPMAGGLLAGATVDGVQSARADYRVTANLAAMRPLARPYDGNILPETFVSIATQPLRDTFGNLVDDGVGLSLLLSEQSGAVTLLAGVVRDGSAQSTLLTRDISGAVTGQIVLAGTASDGLQIFVDPLVMADPGDIVIWSEPSIHAVHLRIGPMQTDKGYLVPDGTYAEVSVTAQDGLTAFASGWVLDGYLSFTLPLLQETAPFDIVLLVGGNRETASVTVSQPPESLTIRGIE